MMEEKLRVENSNIPEDSDFLEPTSESAGYVEQSTEDGEKEIGEENTKTDTGPTEDTFEEPDERPWEDEPF